MRLRERVLLWLLDTANDNPPMVGKREFYAIKERLLTKYAQREGTDVQYIERECWHCVSQDACYVCGGSGIYERVWVLLERWRWGAHVFHRPAGRSFHAPEGFSVQTAIRGYVQHKTPKYYLAAEAWYVLALLFDRPTFWRVFGVTGYLGPKRTPLVILGTWLSHYRAWREARQLRAIPGYNLSENETDDLPF